MNTSEFKVVIMAGGRGTRIASLSADAPKPMIPICGKPVLQHEIECLCNQGFKDIIITVSYKAETIIDYFGDGSLGQTGELRYLRPCADLLLLKDLHDHGSVSFIHITVVYDRIDLHFQLRCLSQINKFSLLIIARR